MRSASPGAYRSGMARRNAWCASLAALLLSLPAQAQEVDQFTPVVVAPLTQANATVLGTDGRYHVVYELELTNARPERATVESLEILGTGEPPAVVTRLDGAALRAGMRLLDRGEVEDTAIPFGESRLLLLHLAFAGFPEVPLALRHRLQFQGLAGPVAKSGTYTVAPVALEARVPVVGPPLRGRHWVAFNGCCAAGGAHRSAVLPVNGRLRLAQRYAIDWMRLDEKGRLQEGDAADVKSYTSYGAEILAVADGVVVDSLDTLDDQVPPNLPDPKTITLRNVDGNHVVLDLGNGFFAFYAHMQKGSVTVEVGQRVERGQILGKLGNTGNTSAPHLHFHVMDGPSVLGSNGVPYVIDAFEVAGQIPPEMFADVDGDALAATDWSRGLAPAVSVRQREFPLDLTIVNFP